MSRRWPARGPTGVKPRLSDADLQRVEQALLEGKGAHGVHRRAVDLARIAQLIQRLTAVRYHIVFFDESGASLLPNVRRTWAPVGRPPLLRNPFNWQRASMAAALCYGAAGGGASLAFHLHPGSYDTAGLIEVIRQLVACEGLGGVIAAARQGIERIRATCYLPYSSSATPASRSADHLTRQAGWSRAPAHAQRRP